MLLNTKELFLSRRVEPANSLVSHIVSIELLHLDFTPRLKLLSCPLKFVVPMPKRIQVKSFYTPVVFLVGGANYYDFRAVKTEQNIWQPLQDVSGQVFYDFHHSDR